MGNESRTNAPRAPNRDMIPRRFVTLRERDPKQPTARDQEQDARETRIALSVKRATWVIAVATAINVVVVGLQWRELEKAYEPIKIQSEAAIEAAKAGTGQLVVMQNQLEEMRSTGAQTEAIISANKKFADAAVKQAEAATASVAIIQSQLTVMQGQLAEMKGTSTKTDKIIDANQKLAEATVRQADAARSAAETARESMIATQRAWIGASNAKIEGSFAAGQEATIALEFHNTGREPASDSVTNVSWFTTTKEDDLVGINGLESTPL
jgi:hypothetical protein